MSNPHSASVSTPTTWVWRAAWLAFPSLLVACGEITDPYPQPLPHNVAIESTPASGALVTAADIDSVWLTFDRPMERESLQSVQRVSFLMPLALRSFDGRWAENDTRITFDLGEFPVQAGATYEARFVGLRTAEGELFNGGPYEMRFRTRGTPDLFPLQPHARVATRVLCRRAAGTRDGDCTALTMHVQSEAAETVSIRTAVEDQGESRLDWYARVAGHIVWLGWDDRDADEVVVRSVRWPQPPRLCAQPTTRGTVLTAEAQTAPSGERLESWRSHHAGSDSPVANVLVEEHVVEVAYTGSTTFDLDYSWRDHDGITAVHHERWWLYPGVGIVRRDVRIERDDGSAVAHFVDLLQPSLVNLVR